MKCKAIYKVKEWERFEGDTIKFKGDAKEYKVNDAVKKYWAGKGVNGKVKVGFDNNIVVYIKEEDPSKKFNVSKTVSNDTDISKNKTHAGNYWQDKFDFDKDRNEQIRKFEQLKHHHITKEACLNSAIATLRAIGFNSTPLDTVELATEIAERYRKYILEE